MGFNIFNSLVLAGILQGFALGAIVLGSKKYNNPAVRWLGCLIIVFSLNNLQYYLRDTGIISTDVLFRYVFIPFQLLSGPLLLFYGRNLIFPNSTVPKRMFLTLVPFALFWAGSLFIKVMYWLDMATPGLIIIGNIALVFIEIISIVIDICVLVYLLRHIKPQLSNGYSETVHPALDWFRSILRALFALSVLWICVTAYTIAGGVVASWYLIWISMSVLIYCLGHVGVYKYGVEQERKNIRLFSIEHKSPIVEKSQNEHIAAFERIVIGKKLFLDPSLTLDVIADELKISKSHLSRMINAELQMGFPDYVNSLRIEEAKTYLSNPDFSNYTLVAIGLEAGFASKTTFNHTFKKFTGMTPSEYKNQISNTLLNERIA